VFFAIGTALYFVSPILTIVAAAMGGLGAIMPLFAGGLTTIAPALATFGAAATAVIPFLLTITAVALGFAAAIFAIAAAIALVSGNWEYFTAGIGNIVDSLGGLVSGVTAANEELAETAKIPEIPPGTQPGDYESNYEGSGWSGYGQEVNVDQIQVNIENVTSDVDLEDVTDSVTDGVSEGVRRRGP
jgi:hypothetical protein